VTIDKLQFVFSLFGICLLATFFISWVLIRLTLDRRVRKTLPKNKIYQSYMDNYLGIGRAATFAWCAIISNKKHADLIKLYYNNVNIYTFANRFEKYLSYGMIGSLFILLFIFGPIIFITDWLNILEWD